MYRLERLKGAGKGILCYFRDNIGKIEIMGKSGRMEKVYFEIESSRRRQWKNKQIVESRKHFLQTSEVGSSREKLESFINFCEDTIFEVSKIPYIHLSTINAPNELHSIVEILGMEFFVDYEKTAKFDPPNHSHLYMKHWLIF